MPNIPNMREPTFDTAIGCAFIALFLISAAYATVRTIYERYRTAAEPPGPSLIPFHMAVRLSQRAHHARMLAESDTVRLIPATAANGVAIPYTPQSGHAENDHHHTTVGNQLRYERQD